MQLYKMLNELLSLMTICSDSENIENAYHKVIFRYNKPTIRVFYTVSEDQQYTKLIKDILNLLHKKNYLSKETITDYILRQLIILKIEEIHFTIAYCKELVKDLISLQRETIQVITNIVGIELENNQKPIQMGCFEVGYNRDITNNITQAGGLLDHFFQQDDLIYFKANIYHLDFNGKQAKNIVSLYRLDFNRLLLFISKGLNRKNIIKIGSTLYYDNDNIITIDNYNYSYYNTEWQSVGASYTSTSSAKLSINELISSDFYEHFKILWDLYRQKSEELHLTDIQNRILSASLAVGESIRSEEEKNSLIYTCIALEALFSLDEGQLFQRSIGDKLSDCLAFIIGTNKEDRKNIIKYTKEIYRARSALVHGSQSSKAVDLYHINDFLRTAVAELLNNKKYKDIKTINQLYDMIKDAQLSY